MAYKTSQPVGAETRHKEVASTDSHEEYHDAAGVRENRNPQKRASQAPSNSSRQASTRNTQKSTESANPDGKDSKDSGDDESDGDDDRHGKDRGGKGGIRTDGRTDLDRNVAVNQAGFRENNKG